MTMQIDIKMDKGLKISEQEPMQIYNTYMGGRTAKRRTYYYQNHRARIKN